METLKIAGADIESGQSRNLTLELTRRASGAPGLLPLSVWSALSPGPTVLLTGALHGDELNGTGIVRALLRDPDFELLRGTLVMVPVLNIFGFERKTRYMPDRRDLNRAFPGTSSGSLSSRVAARIFEDLVSRVDYLVDLHTAAVNRTNLPNVRADFSNAQSKRIARAFGSELVIHGKGPEGSLRRAAVDHGIPTVVLEAGEVWKIEPSVIEVGVRGVRNVLIELDMVDGKRIAPTYQALIRKTRWVRSNDSGLLDFHVVPGTVVEEGQAVASCYDLLGKALGTVRAPASGVIMGMTTLPSVTAGDPVCHLAIPRGVKRIVKALERAKKSHLIQRVRADLATSMAVAKVET